MNDREPDRVSLHFDPQTNTITVGNLSSVVAPAGDAKANDAVLEHYLSLVAAARGSQLGPDLQVRAEDVEILAVLLHLDDELLEARIIRILGVDRHDASDLRARLFRQRLLIGAVSVTMGILGVAPVTASSAAGSAPPERKPVDIGSALVIERAQQPADPHVRLGDSYTYER